MCLLYGSNGRGGYHLWVLFSKPIPATVLHRFGDWLVSDHAQHGFAKPPEVFPNNVRETLWGHWMRLPGRHPKREVWSKVWNGKKWVTGAEAVKHILSITKTTDPKLIPADVKTAPNPSPKLKAKVTL